MRPDRQLDTLNEEEAYAAELEMDIVLSRLLRGGVLIAAAIALVGGAIYIAQYGHLPTDHRAFRGEPPALRSTWAIIRGATQLRSRWLIQLGLLLLIATPILRVAVSLVAFARQRDRTYVVITAIVLALLLFSLFAGAGGG